MLDADRSDFELAVLTLEDDAVVVVGLRMDDFAQIEIYCRAICRVVARDKPAADLIELCRRTLRERARAFLRVPSNIWPLATAAARLVA